MVIHNFFSLARYKRQKFLEKIKQLLVLLIQAHAFQRSCDTGLGIWVHRSLAAFWMA